MKARPDVSTKPYYRCLSCPRFRKICGGMPTRGLDLKEWCEYIRDVMDHFHLTIAYVANEAEISKKTMEKISAGSIDDIRRVTARRVELVVFGQVGEHTCYLDRDDGTLSEQVKKLLVENEELRKENARKAKIIDKLLA